MENKKNKTNAVELNEEELENVSGGGDTLTIIDPAKCIICGKALLSREQVKEEGVTFCFFCHKKWINKEVSI